MQKQLCPQQVDYTLIKGDASAFEVVNLRSQSNPAELLTFNH